MFFDSIEVKLMTEWLEKAGHIAKKVQQEIGTESLDKSDNSPVTVADLTIQTLISREIQIYFPQDSLIGEESSNQLKKPEHQATLQQVLKYIKEYHPKATEKDVLEWIDWGKNKKTHRHWTLDPIDGTKGFLRGDQFATAIALIQDGKVQIGGLGCPHLEKGSIENNFGTGSLLIAGKNYGCWLRELFKGSDFYKLKVSQNDEITQLRMLRSKESGHTNPGNTEKLLELLEITAEAIRMDSQAKYAVLASGNAELLIRFLSVKQPNYKEKIWDQAAGSLVFQEAGGIITDLNGHELDFSHGPTLLKNTGIVATNSKKNHQIILKELQKMLSVPLSH